MSNVEALWDKLDTFIHQKNIELQKFNNEHYIPKTTCHGELIQCSLPFTRIADKNSPTQFNGQVFNTCLQMGKATQIPEHLFKEVYNEGSSIIEHFCAGKALVVSKEYEKHVTLDGITIGLVYGSGISCHWVGLVRKA